MTIYLYKKTHKITGLKYLGKTSKNPYKYLGSGLKWIQHLKEHGKEIDTEILKECYSNEEVSFWGRYYSDLWNVSKSDEWANIIPETGGSAAGRKRPRQAIEITAKKNSGKTRTDEFKSNRTGALNPFYQKTHTAETRQKMSENHANVSGSNNPMYGKKHPNNGIKGEWQWSEKARMKVSGPNNPMYGKPSPNKGKIQDKFQCPYCSKQVSKGNLSRWHGDNCKDKDL